ncbi:uncharacterized protein LOC106476369 [Limulus polyphemus]|uniref:Uncharacterized protein LOC106476369 n=1 Tax=Limulus polyphemus TaxID=6850 RepID=A0ABM1C192_LIMPO|nr:uncharacterized protein LOC106476369 [Limulus polyphemus]
MPERNVESIPIHLSKQGNLLNLEEGVVKSEDAGLGTTNNFQFGAKKRLDQLTIDFNQQTISRCSSFEGSCTSLANTPTPGKNSKCSWQKERTGIVVMLSAVYAKLLVVMGICFPLGEVISHRIPISYYEVCIEYEK